MRAALDLAQLTEADYNEPRVTVRRLTIVFAGGIDICTMFF
jgi:hypothetical protein